MAIFFLLLIWLIPWLDVHLVHNIQMYLLKLRHHLCPTHIGDKHRGQSQRQQLLKHNVGNAEIWWDSHNQVSLQFHFTSCFSIGLSVWTCWHQVEAARANSSLQSNLPLQEVEEQSLVYCTSSSIIVACVLWLEETIMLPWFLVTAVPRLLHQQ